MRASVRLCARAWERRCCSPPLTAATAAALGTTLAKQPLMCVRLRARARLDVRPQWMTRRPALSQRDPSCSCLRVRKPANTSVRTRSGSICRWLLHSWSTSFHLASSPLTLYQSGILRQEVTSLLMIPPPHPPFLRLCFNL